MLRDAAAVARIDCLQSFARIACERRYVRPVLDDGKRIDIRQGRHPVIETLMPVGEEYIPNDVMLDDKQQQIMMITGPNMSGKSALLRQTALIILMAQMGSLRTREVGPYRLCGQDFHARRGFGQHFAGRVDLHGRDARIGQHPQ